MEERIKPHYRFDGIDFQVNSSRQRRKISKNEECEMCGGRHLMRNHSSIIERSLIQSHNLSIHFFYRHLANKALFDPREHEKLSKLLEEGIPQRVLGAYYTKPEARILLTSVETNSYCWRPYLLNVRMSQKLVHVRTGRELTCKKKIEKRQYAEKSGLQKHKEFFKENFTDTSWFNEETTIVPKEICLSYIGHKNDFTTETSSANVLDELSNLLRSPNIVNKLHENRNFKKKNAGFPAKYTGAMVREPNTLEHLFKLDIKGRYHLMPENSKDAKTPSVRNQTSIPKLKLEQKKQEIPATKLTILRNNLQAALNRNRSSKRSPNISPQKKLLRAVKSVETYGIIDQNIQAGQKGAATSERRSLRLGIRITVENLKSPDVQLVNIRSLNSTPRIASFREPNLNKIEVHVPQLTSRDLGKRSFNHAKTGAEREDPHSLIKTKEPIPVNQSQTPGKFINPSKFSIEESITKLSEKHLAKGKSQRRSGLKDTNGTLTSSLTQRSENTGKTSVSLETLVEMKNKLRIISDRKKGLAAIPREENSKVLPIDPFPDYSEETQNIYARTSHAGLSRIKFSGLESHPSNLQLIKKSNSYQNKQANIDVAAQSFWHKLAETKKLLAKK